MDRIHGYMDTLIKAMDTQHEIPRSFPDLAYVPESYPFIELFADFDMDCLVKLCPYEAIAYTPFLPRNGEKNLLELELPQNFQMMFLLAEEYSSHQFIF